MDSGLGEEVVVLKVPGLPGNRLVFASTGPVNRDFDDVRRFSDAAVNGIKRSDDGRGFIPPPCRPSCLWSTSGYFADFLICELPGP